MKTMVTIKEKLSSEFITKFLQSFLGKGSYTLFTLLFSLVCTRLYGAEAFGEFTFAYTLALLLMVFATAGLDNGLIYHIPKFGNKYISLSFVVNMILSVVIVVTAILFVNDPFVKLMLPLIWLLSIEQIFFGIYRADGKIKEYFFINGFASILLRIVLIISFYFIIGSHVYSIALAVYISFVFSNIIYFLQTKSKFEKIVYNKSFLKYSFPLVLAAGMGILMNKIDIIMLGTMTDNRSVGIYQIASQVGTALSILLVIFNTVFAPKISQLYHKGKIDNLRALYVRSTRILGLVGLIITVVMIIFSKYILLIFGSEIVDGQMALILRGLGQFANIAVGSVWFMLSMTGRPKLQMYGVTAAFLLNVVLNFILIPKYGIDGAAFASLLAVAFSNILGYILVSKIFKVKAYGIV